MPPREEWTYFIFKYYARPKARAIFKFFLGNGTLMHLDKEN